MVVAMVLSGPVDGAGAAGASWAPSPELVVELTTLVVAPEAVEGAPRPKRLPLSPEVDMAREWGASEGGLKPQPAGYG